MPTDAPQYTYAYRHIWMEKQVFKLVHGEVPWPY